MSIKSRHSHAQGRVLGQPERRPRRRNALFVILGICAVLVLAYIDGGEEPIRPIAEQIDVPGSAGRSE